MMCDHGSSLAHRRRMDLAVTRNTPISYLNQPARKTEVNERHFHNTANAPRAHWPTCSCFSLDGMFVRNALLGSPLPTARIADFTALAAASWPKLLVRLELWP